MTSLDGNRDDKLSTSEFASFLSKFTAPGTGTDAATSPAHEGPAPLMAGFNEAKLSDPNHNTVKYLFGRVAQHHSLASVHDGASAESVLQEMLPALEAAGITVSDVSKDKIQVLDDEGQATWIDVIRGANSTNPAFQWLDTRF
jgi:hypothetical protein